MSKLTPILLFELRSTLRRRSFQIATAAFPILGIAVILLVRLVSTLVGEDVEKVQGYVDQWGRLPTEASAGALLRPFDSQEQAQAALLSGEIESYYLIPTHYLASGVVQKYTTSEGGVFGMSDVSPLLHSLLIQTLVEELSPEAAARVQVPVVVETIRLTAEGEVAPKGRDEFSRFFLPYGFSILLYMALAFSSGFLVQSVAEEKQSRTIEILLSSVSPTVLMAGKVVGLGAAGLLQVLVWLLSAWLLATFAGSLLPLPADFTIDPVMLVLGAIFFILAYLFFGTILAGLGAMMPSVQEASQVSGFVSMFAIVPLFFIAPILDEPNGTLARVFTYVPFTTPLTVMLRLSAATPPWLDIVGGGVVLALAAVAGTFLGARVFRAFLLLYGQRPGRRELWRALWAP